MLSFCGGMHSHFHVQPNYSVEVVLCCRCGYDNVISNKKQGHNNNFNNNNNNKNINNNNNNKISNNNNNNISLKKCQLKFYWQ